MKFQELENEANEHLVSLYKIGMESEGGEGLASKVEEVMRGRNMGDLADALKNGTYKR